MTRNEMRTPTASGRRTQHMDTIPRPWTFGNCVAIVAMWGVLMLGIVIGAGVAL